MVTFAKFTVARVIEFTFAPNAGYHSWLHRMGKSDIPEQKLSCIVVYCCNWIKCMYLDPGASSRGEVAPL